MNTMIDTHQLLATDCLSPPAMVQVSADPRRQEHQFHPGQMLQFATMTVSGTDVDTLQSHPRTLASKSLHNRTTSKILQALLRAPLSLSPTRLCEELKSLSTNRPRKAAKSNPPTPWTILSLVADGYKHPATVSEHDPRLCITTDFHQTSKALCTRWPSG